MSPVRRRLATIVGVVLVGAGIGATGALVVGGSGTSAPATTVARATAPATTVARVAPRTVPRLPPIPPARPGVAEVLSQGPAKGGKVAFTFDDGFCAPCVARIVRVLERTGAHATFFPNGRYADSWEPMAKRIRVLVALGQVTIGNHTFSHGDARTQSAEAFGADLDRNERWIQRTFHVSGRPWFRPPYGSYSDTALRVAGEQGYTKVILWSGTTADSDPRSVPYLLNAIHYWAKPGAIILMHGNYPNTAKSLPKMLDIVRRKHLKPVTIAELLGHR